MISSTRNCVCVFFHICLFTKWNAVELCRNKTSKCNAYGIVWLSVTCVCIKDQGRISIEHVWWDFLSQHNKWNLYSFDHHCPWFRGTISILQKRDWNIRMFHASLRHRSHYAGTMTTEYKSMYKDTLLIRQSVWSWGRQIVSIKSRFQGGEIGIGKADV